MNYRKIRDKYPEFIFRNYNYKFDNENLVADFRYEIKPDLEFKHSVIFKNVDLKRCYSLDHFVLDNLIFHLGLIEIPSYWKTTCSQKITIECGSLDSWQVNWWKKLLLNGMGQYFYENKIDFTEKNFLEISSAKSANKKSGKAATQKTRPLIPVGGGKDSAVTLGIAKEAVHDYAALIIKPSSIASNVITDYLNFDQIVVERIPDMAKILELNSKGYLNGHIPISAVFYFISVLAAYLHDYSEILFSNEISSDEGNIIYLEHEINHQYSKTLKFENDFRDYNRKYLSQINLFSLLRPLYEIEISKLFSNMDPKLLSIFRSCNIGQKSGTWCCKCPKCLSTFILLFPFLGGARTLKIFGKNLYDDKSLKNLLSDLTERDRIKPFECVGTRTELKVALNMAIKQYGGNNLPVLLEYFRNSAEFDPANLDRKENELMKSWGKNNVHRLYSNLLKAKLW